MFTNILADDTVRVTVIAILELSSGIIAACIPACMAFIPFRRNGERPWHSLSTTKRAANAMDDSVPRQRLGDSERVEELDDLPKHKPFDSAREAETLDV